MSMYNEIDWRRNDNGKTCTRNSSSVAECAKKFSRGHWSFFALGSEEKWYVTLAHEPDGLLKKGAEEMLIICAESRHPFFRGMNECFVRRISGKQRWWETSTHYNAEPTTAELLQRVIAAVNQLNVYGAVGGWCQDVARRIKAHSAPSKESPVSNAELPRLKSHQRTYRTSPNHNLESWSPRKLGTATRR